MENKLIQSFIQILDRDLGKLESEMVQYPNESAIWRTAGEIKNTAGNLCLHLCGNLQHYIGANLGKSGYQRNRPLEFSDKNVPRAKLLQEIQKTRDVVSGTLQSFMDDDLVKPYPEEALGYPMTMGFFLIHLTAHLSYHLGQINYHRRMIASSVTESHSYH
jgi:uncharacterized damage-inducible protein DinB